MVGVLSVVAEPVVVVSLKLSEVVLVVGVVLLGPAGVGGVEVGTVPVGLTLLLLLPCLRLSRTCQLRLLNHVHLQLPLSHRLVEVRRFHVFGLPERARRCVVVVYLVVAVGDGLDVIAQSVLLPAEVLNQYLALLFLLR